MMSALREAAAGKPDVEVIFVGHAKQAELPAMYARCRLFLFPTLHDPWGVVANEASAAGTPVLVSAGAGAADDLVLDGVSGRVLRNDEEEWAAAAAALLDDRAAWSALSHGASAQSARFTADAAADGIAAAVWHAVNARRC
jgi:glycosyltransferase involved in cell wall biosynthesis